MGLGVKESPQSAAAFVRSRGITYPSPAVDGGKPLLGLNGRAAATVPTALAFGLSGATCVGVLGALGESTLTGLMRDALLEHRQGASP